MLKYSKVYFIQLTSSTSSGHFGSMPNLIPIIFCTLDSIYYLVSRYQQFITFTNFLIPVNNIQCYKAMYRSKAGLKYR